MRLSKEDSLTQQESNSIQTQRILLRQYAEIHFRGAALYEFIDDGYSGTNFNRPGITELWKAVKEQKIEGIIVKDFSRLSRDYIELGTYLDQIFPFMNIRFISVNDRYDSASHTKTAGNLDFSFRNLLCDFYSKDLSVKVKSALSAGKENGQYMSSNVPFGYQKTQEDKHMLRTLPEEAEIVKRIFVMTLEGMSSVQIAKLLNHEQVKTPIQFRIERGEVHRRPKGDHFCWNSTLICQILRNESYTGAFVFGKYETTEVGKKAQLKPRKEWKVYQNHHEPIIETEIFWQIQRNRGNITSRKHTEKHPLTGKIVCGCCGRNLYIRRTKTPYFICPNLYLQEQNDCIRRVEAAVLEENILIRIQKRIKKKLDLPKLVDERADMLRQESASLLKEIKKLHSVERILLKKREEAYKAYVLQKEPLEFYLEISSQTMIEEKRTEIQLTEMKKKTEILQKELELEPDFSVILSFLGCTVLTSETVHRWIEKITVYGEDCWKIDWK